MCAAASVDRCARSLDPKSFVRETLSIVVMGRLDGLVGGEAVADRGGSGGGVDGDRCSAGYGVTLTPVSSSLRSQSKAARFSSWARVLSLASPTGPRVSRKPVGPE